MRALFALCFSLFLSLALFVQTHAASAAESIPFGRPIMSNDTFVATKVANAPWSNPYSRGRLECYTEQFGTFQVKNKHEDFTNLLGEKVRYYAATYTRPQVLVRTDTCPTGTTVWVEETKLRTMPVQ